jgi:hypothetical protein
MSTSSPSENGAGTGGCHPSLVSCAINIRVPQRLGARGLPAARREDERRESRGAPLVDVRTVRRERSDQVRKAADDGGVQGRALRARGVRVSAPSQEQGDHAALP